MTLRSEYAARASASYGRNSALYQRERDRGHVVAPAPRVAVAGSPGRRIHVGDGSMRMLALSPEMQRTVSRALVPRGGSDLARSDAGMKVGQLVLSAEDVQAAAGAKLLKNALPPDAYFSLQSDAAVPTANNGTENLTVTNNTRDVWLLNFETDPLMVGWYISSWVIGEEINRIKSGEISAAAWAAILTEQLAQPKSKRWNRQETITATAVNRTGAPAFFRMGIYARYLDPPCE